MLLEQWHTQPAPTGVHLLKCVFATREAAAAECQDCVLAASTLADSIAYTTALAAEWLLLLLLALCSWQSVPSPPAPRFAKWLFARTDRATLRAGAGLPHPTVSLVTPRPAACSHADGCTACSDHARSFSCVGAGRATSAQVPGDPGCRARRDMLQTPNAGDSCTANSAPRDNERLRLHGLHFLLRSSTN